MLARAGRATSASRGSGCLTTEPVAETGNMAILGPLAVLRRNASVGYGGRADLPIIPAKLLRPE
jgi:hypothetical protein